ncbi:hypothetical protein H5410_056584 [Solanum commersonii]|uniref:Uncharacterized protein n=1 Tax=Solanum commersonii TaxID=4109 RepID=A0A9J5WLQ4_SOLCO|nr:hypothetical protein H5410_056584 [Solanum commersonii]
MTSEIQITKRSMDYRTRKLAKRGVYLLRSLFDFENGPIFPSGHTDCIANVLTDVHEKYR